MSDEELVRLIFGKDESALDVLAKRYIGKNVVAPVGYLDCDDITQEAMIGFLNAVRTFDASKNIPFSAYASRCMKNSALTAVSKGSEKLAVDAEADVDALVSHEDPLDRYISGEKYSSFIKVCDDSLSSFEKSVLFCHATGLSNEEISAKFSASKKSVENALSRARKKLKDVIA